MVTALRRLLADLLRRRLYLGWMLLLLLWTDYVFGIDINMVAGDNPGGPGFIGGSIADGAGKSLSELGGIMVILLDANGNPVGFTHTDEDGNYSFDNLAYGTYTIHVEILNIPSEQQTVTIRPRRSKGRRNQLCERKR